MNLSIPASSSSPARPLSRLSYIPAAVEFKASIETSPPANREGLAGWSVDSLKDIFSRSTPPYVLEPSEEAIILSMFDHITPHIVINLHLLFALSLHRDLSILSKNNEKLQKWLIQKFFSGYYECHIDVSSNLQRPGVIDLKQSFTKFSEMLGLTSGLIKLIATPELSPLKESAMAKIALWQKLVTTSAYLKLPKPELSQQNLTEPTCHDPKTKRIAPMEGSVLGSNDTFCSFLNDYLELLIGIYGSGEKRKERDLLLKNPAEFLTTVQESLKSQDIGTVQMMASNRWLHFHGLRLSPMGTSKEEITELIRLGEEVAIFEYALRVINTVSNTINNKNQTLMQLRIARNLSALQTIPTEIKDVAPPGDLQKDFLALYAEIKDKYNTFFTKAKQILPIVSDDPSQIGRFSKELSENVSLDSCRKSFQELHRKYSTLYKTKLEILAVEEAEQLKDSYKNLCFTFDCFFFAVQDLKKLNKMRFADKKTQIIPPDILNTFDLSPKIETLPRPQTELRPAIRQAPPMPPEPAVVPPDATTIAWQELTRMANRLQPRPQKAPIPALLSAPAPAERPAPASSDNDDFKLPSDTRKLHAAVAALPGVKLIYGKRHTLVVTDDEKRRLITVLPRHFGQEVPPGTLHSIEEQLRKHVGYRSHQVADSIHLLNC